MDEIDLSSDVPVDAEVIEITVTTNPKGGLLRVRRFPGDEEPITMGHGASTRLGAPENRRLYVEKVPPTETFTLHVTGWMD